jgi:diadenosine tetraphosphatase ApaH/serine/threonine PP2A family protein phosphatase
MRALLLGDLHANLAALAAILADVQACGGADEVWSLGDLIGYGPGPAATLRALAELPALDAPPLTARVPGNHDTLIAGARIVRAGRAPLHPERFSVAALLAAAATAMQLGEFRHALALADAALTRREFGAAHVPANLREQLKQLPGCPDDAATAAACEDYLEAVATELAVEQTREPDGLPVVLVHGTLEEPLTGYSTELQAGRRDAVRAVPAQCAAELAVRLGARVALERAPLLVCGHTHQPMLITAVADGAGGWSYQAHPIRVGVALPLGEGPSLVNPGGAGCSRDGDPRAAYALLDTVARTVEFRRVALDESALARELKALPGGQEVLSTQWPHLVL